MAYAADKQPLQLTALTSLADGDGFVVGDADDATEVAKYITKANLVADLADETQALTNKTIDADNNTISNIALGAEATGALGDLSNVTESTVGNDEVLQYVTDHWENQTLAEAGIAPVASPTFTGTVTLPTGLTGVIRADSGVVSVDTDVTDIVAAASDTAAGKVELATDAETVTGTDTARATTPANLTAKMAAPGAIGGTTPAAATFTTVTVNTGVTLAENASIALDPAGSADGKFTGITVTGTGGATIAFGDVVYLAVADSRWELADASAASTAGSVMLGIAVSTSTDGNPITVLLHGIIRADTAFPTFTVGAQIFVSETAGDVTHTAPTTTDAVVRSVGFALTTDEMFWNPSPDYQTAV